MIEPSFGIKNWPFAKDAHQLGYQYGGRLGYNFGTYFLGAEYLSGKFTEYFVDDSFKDIEWVNSEISAIASYNFKPFRLWCSYIFRKEIKSNSLEKQLINSSTSITIHNASYKGSGYKVGIGKYLYESFTLNLELSMVNFIEFNADEYIANETNQNLKQKSFYIFLSFPFDFSPTTDGI